MKSKSPCKIFPQLLQEQSRSKTPTAIIEIDSLQNENNGSNLSTGSNFKVLKSPLIWIDLEMTGLDIKKDQIIEIAVIVTDGSLNTVVHGPNLAIKCPETILSTMDQWCTRTHHLSGLTQRVRNSTMTLK